MMAAISAAESGATVTLFEQNEKLGKKIYITGKGRCNLTNFCDLDDYFSHIFENPKFAYSAIYNFTPQMLAEKLSEGGLSIKVERGNRVFPVSDKASDVTKALTKLLTYNKVTIALNTKITKIVTDEYYVKGIVTNKGEYIAFDRIILCCGGRSYPSTGSDGSGYALALSLGHTVKETRPSLVGFISREKWVTDLAGLTLNNVEVALYENDLFIEKKFGDLLFTHKGISGPTILTLSCKYNKDSKSYISIDLKPALDWNTLDKRILRDFGKEPNKEFRNSLNKLMPKNLASKIVDLSGIDALKKVNQITSEERHSIVNLIKGIRINIADDCGYNEAIITKGGVSIKEINPSTMQSKIVKGLYFAGEMISLHGYTGGFNLQLAFSTGRLAGQSCAEQ